MSKTSQPQSVSMPAASLTASASAVVAGDALEAQWQRVRARLRVSFGDAAFNSWLKPVALADEGMAGDGDVHLAVPTRFMRDWVANHYSERLRENWRMETEARKSGVWGTSGSVRVDIGCTGRHKKKKT